MIMIIKFNIILISICDWISLWWS